MTTLYKNEIRWILNHIRNERDESKYLKDCSNQQFAELHKLNYENMSHLYDKLEKLLESDGKRIAIK